ncbi:hypothetical protein AB1Y20_020299 [Prymnesium parvum]|uniref:WW domain-containing protein n=1 Tax=Prymnesium parvum TaxID=97485 RepID=A0AB34JUB1_PRYPA
MWQVATDAATGAPYWWNEKGEVTWVDPTQAKELEVTASGWRKVHDEAAAAAYWWHPQTGQRQWDPPPDAGIVAPPPLPPAECAPEPTGVGAPQPAPATPPTDAADPQTHEESARPAVVEGFSAIFNPEASAAERAESAAAALPSALLQRLAKRGIIGGGSAPPAAAAEPRPQPMGAPMGPLPPGWTAQRDPSGSTFYRHASTGQTSWERPTWQTSCLTHAVASAPSGGTIGGSDPTGGGGGGGVPEKEIVALVLARIQAKQSKDYATADKLLQELRSHGVSVDDQARTWSCRDGRSGAVEGGKRMPTIAQSRMHMVDSKGRVTAEAARAAANAAATGWLTSRARDGGGAVKQSGAQLALTNKSTPSASKVARQDRMIKRAREDPLDPASWEGYEVPVGGWNRGAGGASTSTSAAATSSAPKKPGGPLPSPGEILRMNAGK